MRRHRGASQAEFCLIQINVTLAQLVLIARIALCEWMVGEFMSKVHFFHGMEIPGTNAPSIHGVDLIELAGVADVLVGAGRRDLAAQIISILYYFAERQGEGNNVISLCDIRRGYTEVI
jgi:hypothetical protein